MYRLENWSVSMPRPNAAPEEGCCVHGVVFGHPKFPDGDRVNTSVLQAADYFTSVVTTKSGSQYKLGKPDPEYIKWLEANGLDPSKPFPYFKGVN